MANILFLTQVLPYPLDAGPKLRAYYVLRQLAASHAVTLVSFVRAEDPPEAVQHLASICAAVHTVPMQRSLIRTVAAGISALARNQPVVIVRDEIPAMHRLLAQLLASQHFDFVHADQTSMVQYALWAADHAPSPRPQLVLDAHNALYKVVARLAANEPNAIKRFLLQREAKALLRYEEQTYRRFDHVIFVTGPDQAEFTLPHSHVIPICVEPAAPVTRRQDARQVTFVGALHWPPNAEGVAWFLEQVWPQVDRPDATCVVVGKHPPAVLQASAAALTNVTVTGYVADLTPHLAETAAFVVPLSAGGGMRVKIVDAWSWGVPVVSTTIGAEGLVYTAGKELLLADTPEDFAAAVQLLLDDRRIGDSLVEAGRRRVAATYDWRTVYGAWDAIYPRQGVAQ